MELGSSYFYSNCYAKRATMWITVTMRYPEHGEDASAIETKSPTSCGLDMNVGEFILKMWGNSIWVKEHTSTLDAHTFLVCGLHLQEQSGCLWNQAWLLISSTYGNRDCNVYRNSTLPSTKGVKRFNVGSQVLRRSGWQTIFRQLSCVWGIILAQTCDSSKTGLELMCNPWGACISR